jgi:hypothetical protein
LNIKNDTWDSDIVFLKRPNITIRTAKVYTQALINSNLFDSNIDQHGGLKDLTLSDMATKNNKKPFVCTIIEGIR